MYNICKKTYNDGVDGSHLCLEYADLLADKYSFAVNVGCYCDPVPVGWA